MELISKPNTDKICPFIPNAIQINEYDEDGGCPPHIDAPSIGEWIGMYSLCSPCVMDLEKPIEKDEISQVQGEYLNDLQFHPQKQNGDINMELYHQ